MKSDETARAWPQLSHPMTGSVEAHRDFSTGRKSGNRINGADYSHDYISYMSYAYVYGYMMLYDVI